MMIQLQTRLHAIKVLELDKGEAAAFGGFVFFGCDANQGGRVFDEVGFYGVGVGGVGEVSFIIICG